MPAREGVAGRAEPHLAPVDHVGAGIFRVDAGDDLHRRALAGAVLADETVDLAGAQGKIDVPQGLDTAEGLRDADKLEQRTRRIVTMDPLRSGSDPASTASRPHSPS